GEGEVCEAGGGAKEYSVSEALDVTRLAVVLFAGSPVPDVYGPVQAFGACRVTRPDGPPHRFFKVFTIADRVGPIPSGEGPSTHADHAFADAPDYDILVVPGGFGTRTAIRDEAFLAKVRAASARAPLTTTLSTGSAMPP